ncbi:MAG: glycoside hydrolase family 3 C-terminal domain-containing protein [Chitinispirillaceae bacterium]|nr:glycoside hydrolase family 3 C-terminal domain-containing protein [Chitinispirillaceae bacterium]
MNGLMISAITAALFISTTGEAARISDVTVDFVKGYAKCLEQNGDTGYYYMGRVTYHLLAEGMDSIIVDFKVARKGTEDTLPIYQLTGDIGPVKQKNAGDTLKTAFFRTGVTKDFSGEFVGVVSAGAGMSRMWRMADSLGRLMSLDQRQWSLYTNMSLDKVYHFFGQDTYQLPDGTPIVGWRCADGPHGTRYPLGPSKNDFDIYGSGDTATLFPTEAALGCSWDTDLTYRVGKAIGKEARALGVYCILGPMCDLVINPRWGRAFETMGEDPYLTGKMVASQVQGLQSVKVIACPKHFTPYVTEASRMSNRIIVEERALRELFCEPFRMALQEGGARAIMTCYHRVRVPGFTIDDANLINKSCERAGSNRHTINTILRNDWGFDGIVMTDWDGAAGVDEAYSYETDYDMSMPQGGGGFIQIANNIRSNLWKEEPLNRKVMHIMYGKLWAWDGKLLTSEEQIITFPRNTILCQEHKDLSLDAARRSITLVKNDAVDGKPVLPLDKNATLKIAVVGPYANLARPGGGGSSVVTPDKIVTLLQGMRDYAAQHTTITITEDYNDADIAVVCVGVDKESEDYDRPSMILPSNPINQNELVGSVMAKVKQTVVVYTGGSASVAGKWSDAPAIIVAFYPGREQGTAMAEAIFGDINPGGHLNVTFPKTVSDLPVYDQTDHELTLASSDSAHGYFYFEKTGKTPLFWFGHGLSYTSFTFDNIRLVGSSAIAAGDRIDVVVTVTNTGDIAGDEVVQLYVKPKSGSIPRRVKDLRGFTRVTLAAKQTKEVPFTLGPRDFSVYTPDKATKTGKWEVVPGEYELIAGSTSDPAVLTGKDETSAIIALTVN